MKNNSIKAEIKIQTEVKIETKEQSNNVITLPNGAIVEMGASGNIVKYIKEANRQEELVSVQNNKKLTTTEISRMITPAIVHIKTFTTDSSGDGSGFIIDDKGYIITAAHVVKGFADVQVILNNNNKYTGKVVGRDEFNDIALIKIKATGFNYVTLGNSNDLYLGDIILVYGHPLGLQGVVVSAGILGGKQPAGNYTYLQTDAKTQPGSSGGAWVNERGEIIGVHVAGIGPKIQGIKINEGLNFAVPINFVKTLIPKLKKGVSEIDYLSQPIPSKGSIIEIRQQVMTSAALNPDMSCSDLGFEKRDLYACILYNKDYRNDYEWKIVGVYSESSSYKTEDVLSSPPPSTGSIVQISRTTITSISYNPSLTCKQLTFTGDNLDKCLIYKNSKDLYKWEIVD